MSAARRVAALILVAGTLAGAAVIDDRFEADPPESTTGPQMPQAAATSARSSAFFCAGATAADGGLANGTLVIANAGAEPLSGTVTAYPSEGEPVSRDLVVTAAGRTTVPLTEMVEAPYAAATVLLDGGDGVVELAGTGPRGPSLTPCASAASRTWYFAEGITTRDASAVVSLLNPFPDDALVDMRFMTEEGQVTPEDLTGLTVPGRSLMAVDLAEHVQRREEVATSIEVRTGRLVAARLQAFDGTNGREGTSMALGAPSPGEVWYFPDGFVSDDVDERIQLFNPASTEASIQIDLTIAGGSAEPLLLVVPPESRLTVAAGDESRIPKDEPHSLVVRELNGVGIVAERSIDASRSGGPQGTAYALGARLTARRWVLAAGQTGDDTLAQLVVLNPSDSTARISVSLLNSGSEFAVASLQDVEIGPGERWSANLGDSLREGPLPLVVTATQPVVVERALDTRDGPGISKAMGIPLRD